MKIIALGSVFVRSLQLTALCAISSAIVLASAHARDQDKAPDDTHLRTQMFQTKFLQFVNEQRLQENPLPGMVYYMSEILTDRIAQDTLQRNFDVPLFRSDLADQALDVIIREKGKYPILIGEPGAGKTALTELMTYKILAADYPQTSAYGEAFNDAVVLRVSARNFLPGGADLSAYLSTVSFISGRLNRKILVQIYESHFLNDYHVSVLREIADKKASALPIILETDAKSYGNSLKGHPSFTTISRPIFVPQTSSEETKTILRNQLLPRVEAKLKVKINNDVLDAIIELAQEYGREAADPRRSLYLGEEFAIDWNRKGNAATEPNRLDLYRFVARQSRLPVIPQDEEAFSKYMQELRGKVKARVISQDIIVDGLVSQFQTALMSRLRQHSVAMIMGPTGVGKTLSAEVLAEEFYGDSSRVLELDMTQFADTTGLNTLFGASNGFISSDKEKGVICEFLDGAGKGGGVLIMNEIEEAHSEVITRLMELFDKGVVRCGDGRLRHLGRSLIVMTSNKNTDRIMSYDSIRGMKPTELQQRLSQITQDQMKKAFSEKASYTQSDAKVVKSAVLERIDKFYFASPLLQESAVAVSNLEIGKFVREYNKQSRSELKVDPSFGEVLTSAFYNESLGARQIRTAVQQSISNAVQDFKAKYGYKSETLIVSAHLHPSRKTASYVTVKDPATSFEITLDGPKVPVSNKMHDPEFRARLVDLEKNLKSEVFGQDGAISAIASAVKARFLRGGKEDIVAGFLLGTTGAGKSQLGKSAAKFLFGREEALGLFEMGKVQHEHDLYNIFSPPKGIIGSDEPGQLEKFLIQYPDGGVLLFDEMSNAGGNNPMMKDMIAKQFYTLFQEGLFRSPSGKVYDLSKYVVILTGNDGQEIFKGLNSDSMLQQAYSEATKKPNLVREILEKAGFSEAFIGRLSFAVLMQPTYSETKILIARKMINQWKNQVEKEQPFDLKYDDDFVQQIGLLLFSAKAGARSINHFVSSTLGQAVANEALQLDWEELQKSGKRAEIRLSLKIDQEKMPFYAGDKPYENKAALKVETFQDGKSISSRELDFSNAANFTPQVHRDTALATAYHEMGHLVTSFTEVTGKKAVKVTIVPEKVGADMNALGYAQYRNIPTKVEPNRDYLVKNLAGLLAGSEAEIILGRERTVGRSNDAERVGKMARKLVLDLHLIPELDAAHAYADNNGNIIGNLPAKTQAVFDKYISAAIEDARKLAIKTLRQDWHVVVAGAEILMKHGNLSEDEIERLLARGKEARTQSAWHVRALQKMGYNGGQAQIAMSTDGIMTNCEGLLSSAK